MLALKEVRQAISDQGLGWTAEANPIADNYVKGIMPGFGFAPKGREPGGNWKADMIKAKHSHGFFPGEDPIVVDWGAFDDMDYVSPSGDQKQCNSCVAFATCHVLESRMRIVKEDPNLNCKLSVAQLFFCGRGREGCEDGWEIGDALAFIRDNGGIGSASDFPYKLNDMECTEKRKKIKPLVNVTAWRKIKEDDMRFEVIKERGPVIGAMAVYSDFLYYSSGVYRPTTISFEGLHAIAVVGYDKKQGAWIIQNSWGKKWGKGGCAYIGFGSCGIDHEFDFYDVNISMD